MARTKKRWMNRVEALQKGLKNGTGFHRHVKAIDKVASALKGSRVAKTSGLLGKRRTRSTANTSTNVATAAVASPNCDAESTSSSLGAANALKRPSASTPRSSRLPLDPLHMTTRSATKSNSSTSTSAGQGRPGSATQSMLAVAAPALDAEERPAKRARRAKEDEIAPGAGDGGDDDDEDIAPAPPPKRRPGRPKTAKAVKTARGPAPANGGPRLPGRRRAPHPDPVIEADLARQAELRRNYRIVAKALKPSLQVLGERTNKLLEADPGAHEAFPEYVEVRRGLDERLSRRLALVERIYQFRRENLSEAVAAEKAVVENDHKRRLDDLRDDFLLGCKDSFLHTVRAMRLAEEDEATDEEVCDVTLARRLESARPTSPQQEEPADKARQGRPGGPIPGTSRSSAFLETERAWNELDARFRCGKFLEGIAPDVCDRDPQYHAMYDSTDRQAAIATRNLDTLALASEQVDEDGDEAQNAGVSSAEQAAGMEALLGAIDLRSAETPVVEPVKEESQTPKRREPKLGLFLTPKASAAAGTVTARAVRSPPTPTRPAPVAASARGGRPTRPIAPKGPPGRGSNPLSSILNDEEAPGAQLPVAHNSFQPVQYEQPVRYEPHVHPLYSPTLPPPPPYGGFVPYRPPAVLPGPAPQSFPAASLQSFAVTGAGRRPGSVYQPMPPPPPPPPPPSWMEVAPVAPTASLAPASQMVARDAAGNVVFYPAFPPMSMHAPMPLPQPLHQPLPQAPAVRPTAAPPSYAFHAYRPADQQFSGPAPREDPHR
ncbi:MAG: hypothetical protein M1832_004709 [Thelocarpon impressellum]|nr:MAG: hypothetical protein M1832_004709 [Thelocarpon impressellum]